MSELDRRLSGLSAEKRALLMQQLARRSGAPAQQDIGRRPRPERLPLSSAQQRLWILDRLDPGNSVYNVTAVTRLIGQLDVDALTRTLGEIMRRHESLRTVFVQDAEGPMQRILPPVPMPLDRHDLTDLPAEARADRARAMAKQDAVAPFDLERGPMLRAQLLHLDDDQWQLAISAHHIAIDGWSMGVIFRELAALYPAFLAGEPSPLPELPLQYVDYTLWQRDEAEGSAMRAHLDYWTGRFQSLPPVLDIPGDRPRPAVQSYRGDVFMHVLPLPLLEGMRQLSRQEGATPFMVFLAAFQTLLYRYSGQDDIVVGVGNANRPRRELEALVGFFINTLPMRTDLSGNPTFRELLAQVRATTLDSYAHQDLPFERLLESVNVERSLSHNPLFQTMVFYQNFPDPGLQLPGLRLENVPIENAHSGTARADLTIFASEHESGLRLLMEYATDLFDADTVQAFARHLQTLLAAAVADPACRIDQIAILPDDERQRMLVEWNRTTRALPPQATLHGLFEAQAARTPQAVAVVQGDAVVSYAELDAQAGAVAARLRAHGVGPGAMVGLYLERTPRMLAALLGVLKAGAAYVPLDPGFPRERIACMLEDAAAPVVIADAAIASQLPPGAHALLHAGEILDGAALGGAALDAAVVADADETAYVLFTSGSTGRPKGVRVPHRATVNFLASMARAPGLGPDDTLCAITTLSFDIALLELMLPLTVGARVALADRATASEGEALARLLDAVDATVMQATPATWRMLLDAGWRGRPGMRLLCGGEALPRELADRLLGCGSELWNVYGPTETTVWSTIERVQPGEGAVSIGRPIDNTEVYVVDARMQPVPAGVPGELLIGGLGVAQGYLDRPELTREKFIADPFGPRAGGRLYRTGDLARWRRDGTLDVIGRIDHQVKLRGFRIELGEIESVLLARDDVAEAVVVCREDRPGDKRLVAYVVPAAGAALDIAALRATARDRLPDYMVPSAWMALERMPLTPNGKVDRRALPPPEASEAEEHAYVAPRTPEESDLAAIWAEVLGKPRVGVHDNFFELGGHSLLANQLVSRMQKRFGTDIGLRMVFEAPTVAEFAEKLLQMRLGAIDESALAGMLDQLEGLSEAEILELLGS
ncbi:non-ribosomal peptide synthetase [Lysobacter brunescens]|uniref:Amino acid adenylation domain-containing protein n=1 Tax=Lysobacter brunescens TaxID=262323 RepID=A0ABW2YH65_9GAMM